MYVWHACMHVCYLFVEPLRLNSRDVRELERLDEFHREHTLVGRTPDHVRHLGVCMHARVYVCTWVRMYACTHVRICMCTRV